MVLEPTGAMGSFVGECAIDVSTGTCAPGVHDDDQSSLVSVILFGWCTAITILLATAVWLGIRRIRAIEADAGHLPLQVAPIQLLVNIWWRFQKFNVQWDR